MNSDTQKSLKELSSRLEEIKKFQAEVARLEELKPVLDAEERKLMDAADLDDASAVAQLVALRTRRDLIPVKTDQLEDRIADLEAELEKLGPPISGELQKLLIAHREGMVDYVRSVVSKLDSSMAPSEVDRFAQGLEPIRRVSDAVSAGTWIGESPIKRAEYTLLMWERFKAGDLTPEFGAVANLARKAA